MSQLPNFTRGTRGADESRSSVKEVLTSKPRAVIKPDHSLGHYDLSRLKSNYNIAPPSKRGWTAASISFIVSHTALSFFHEQLLTIVDPTGNSCVFEFDSGSTSQTGVKVPSNSNRITIGIQGLTSQAELAGQIFTTVGASITLELLANIDIAAAAIDGSSNYTITITTLAPYIGASLTPPYTNYGSFAASYDGGRGLTDQSGSLGTSGDEIIQPPFSLNSKILRGA